MAKYKIVHYLNQFFGGIGGEDKADFQPEVREEIIGPGMALNAGLGDDYEIVATVICGDNYFGENLDKATDTIIEMVKKYEPDIFDVMVLLAVQFVKQLKSDSVSRYSLVCMKRTLELICLSRM